jgi:hypothetical protein
MREKRAHQIAFGRKSQGVKGIIVFQVVDQQKNISFQSLFIGFCTPLIQSKII